VLPNVNADYRDMGFKENLSRGRQMTTRNKKKREGVRERDALSRGS
jgi:hypothetical protein